MQIEVGLPVRLRRGAALALGLVLLIVAAVWHPVASRAASTLLVGPGHRFAMPCQAIAAARPGDTVAIDARGNGHYNGDVCGWSTNGLTIVGISGRAHIDAAGRSSRGKAIWVIAGDDTRIENIELSGAAVPDRNGAGIRQEGAGLVVAHSYFHDNQDGILAGDNAGSDIVVESSEFARNGAGDGYSHNMYIGHVRSFTLRYSWSHDAKVGHLVKSRAYRNDIRYNRLTGETGTSSYELDLPNGGLSYVVGNVIQQGSRTQNPALVEFGLEGSLNPGSRLYLVNNTLVNGLGRGSAVLLAGGVTALVQNNLSVGSTQLATGHATLRVNCLTSTRWFVNPAAYDFHLRSGSPCIGVSRPAGARLTPTAEYVQPTGRRHRSQPDQRDAGAFGHGAPQPRSTPSAHPSARRTASRSSNRSAPAVSTSSEEQTSASGLPAAVAATPASARVSSGNRSQTGLWLLALGGLVAGGVATVGIWRRRAGPAGGGRHSGPGRHR